MGIGPLKKELESIDQELESAMLRLTETTQRVDDLLADYQAGDGGERRPPASVSLRPTAEQEAAQQSDDSSGDESEDAIDDSNAPESQEVPDDTAEE